MVWKQPRRDSLTYTVLISADGGVNWEPIIGDLTYTSKTIQVQNLPEGNLYVIKVIATDGFNTSKDQSDGTFSIVNLKKVHLPVVIRNKNLATIDFENYPIGWVTPADVYGDHPGPLIIGPVSFNTWQIYNSIYIGYWPYMSPYSVGGLDGSKALEYVAHISSAPGYEIIYSGNARKVSMDMNTATPGRINVEAFIGGRNRHLVYSTTIDIPGHFSLYLSEPFDTLHVGTNGAVPPYYFSIDNFGISP